MVGGNVPEPFAFTGFAPFEAAGAAGHAAENLGHVSGMQHDQPHAFKHPALNAVNDFILHFIMRAVSPPEQNIGIGKDFFGKSVFRFIQSGAADLHIVCKDALSDGVVYTVGIDGGDMGFILFVPELVPDGNSDFLHDFLQMVAIFLCFNYYTSAGYQMQTANT
jgi:hypothetical protein